MWQAKHRRGLLVTPPPTTIEAAIAAYRAPDVPGAEEILNDLAQGMIATKLVPFVDLLVVARVAHDTDTLTALELASSKHALDPLRVGDFGRSAPHSCLFYT
jgi:hypothetical protein